MSGADKWILDNLPEGLTQKVAVPDYDILQDMDLEVGNLDRPKEILVENLGAGGPRADGRADTTEDILSNWKDQVGLFRGSPTWFGIYQGECMQMYVPVWLTQGV